MCIRDRIKRPGSASPLPADTPPDGSANEDYLRRQVEAGYADKVARGLLPERADYRERFGYELSVIVSMGFTDYFLIVADFVGYAKSRGIPVGPGRGSGAVSYTHLACSALHHR